MPTVWLKGHVYLLVVYSASISEFLKKQQRLHFTSYCGHSLKTDSIPTYSALCVKASPVCTKKEENTCGCGLGVV